MNRNRREKQEQAVWELMGKWVEVTPTPDFKKRLMSKINEQVQPVWPRPSYWKKWLSWSWPEIFVPASAFAAMLIVAVSFSLWSPYQPPKHAMEMATVDLLENKELLTDMELFSNLDLLIEINPTELKTS